MQRCLNLLVVSYVLCQALDGRLGQGLSEHDVTYVGNYIMTFEERHHTPYPLKIFEENVVETVRAIGIKFELDPRYEAELRFQVVNLIDVAFDDVYRGTKSLTDAQIVQLFRLGTLPYIINDTREEITDFDSYPVDMQAALVDAFFHGSLRSDIIHLINDMLGSWTQVCLKYLDVTGAWNEDELSSPESQQRMVSNCDKFFTYGQSLNTSIAKYNPCSDRYKLFYPYGPEVGDNVNLINDDRSSGEIFISIPFPFFDQDHDSLWVNTNGIISFLSEVSQYTPDPFPLEGRRVVAPFWGDVDTNRGGNVFWRQTTESGILRKASSHIKEYFKKEEILKFEAIWVLVATWDNVGYFGSENDSLRNTFQAVLVTNGRHSFALFNYGDIVWTTGTASGGDAMTGLGGTPAQVGFNSGDGLVFKNVSESRTPAIVNIDETSNANVTGRYAFRIDGAEIIEGGCNTGGSITIFPSTGTMLGGQEITLVGHCFDGNDILLKFRNLQTTVECHTTKRDKEATCITPIFYEIGRLPFSVSTDGGANYVYDGIFTVLNVEQTDTKVKRLDSSSWRTTNEDVTITWPASIFEAGSVDIHLYGYKEDAISGDFVWTSSVVLGEGISREQGEFSFNPLDFGTHHEIGAVRVSVFNEDGADVETQEAVWSDVHDLIWNFGRNTDPKTLCDKWYNDVINDLTFSADLAAPCPCTLDQARADIGRYTPNPGCRIGSRRSDNCFWKRNAVHCVRVTVPSDEGTGRECCYDAAGSIIESADSFDAGPSHSRHHGGIAPYNSPGKIPYMSHFKEDVLPFYRCCVLSDFNKSLCDKYFELRPSHNCTDYEPPRPATLFGDPHMITLDGLQYTFNGHGEFTLLSVNDGSFVLQGRMAPLESNNIATVFKAFAMKGNSTATVHVERSNRRILDVYVLEHNGYEWQMLDFEEETFWEFQGVTISRTNITDYKISVIFELGVSTQISVVGQAMSLLFLATPEFKNQTAGLLGTWNDNPDDDLLTPEGNYVPVNSSLQDIHYDFGMTWAIVPADSLFYYRVGEDAHTSTDLTYEPLFNLPRSNDSDEVTDICGASLQCIFDYLVTGDEETAKGSQMAVENYVITVNHTSEVVSCGILPTPENGMKNGSSYIAGSVVSFECLLGYNMSGSKQRYCHENGSWDGLPTTCEAILCETIEPPVNGVMEGDSITFNSLVTFGCNEGYNISGEAEILCQIDGTWSGQPPTCETILCEFLAPPVNGTKEGDGLEFNSTVTFDCDDGYNISGQAELLCQSDGTWNGKPPTCESIVCDSVEPPTNGMKMGEDRTYQSVVSFECEKGYLVNGSKEIACQHDGTWDAEPPKCEVILCPTLEPPVNGVMEGDGATINSTVIFDCDEGYNISGEAELSCQSEGTWNGQPPTCEPIVCDSIELPTNGMKMGVNRTYQSVVSFECEKGYLVNGSKEITCQHDGTWDAQPPKCEAIWCDAIEPPLNGYMTGANQTFLSVLTFDCQDGYVISGSRELVCQADGTWSQNTPTCKAIRFDERDETPIMTKLAFIFIGVTFGLVVIFLISMVLTKACIFGVRNETEKQRVVKNARGY
ncbi:protein mesh-like isoform X2 [Ptychodera flava]|uniref:protein mesh-like isoform X2 n=1 Tax=Ptychodera flava TaxID=63121 RepID=UPI003969F7EC